MHYFRFHAGMAYAQTQTPVVARSQLGVNVAQPVVPGVAAAKTTPKNKPDNETTPHKKGKKNKKAATAPLQETKKPKLNKPQKPQSFTATVSVPKKPKP